MSQSECGDDRSRGGWVAERGRLFLAAVLAAVTAFAGLLSGGVAHAGNGAFHLDPGEVLTGGQQLVSQDGQYVLTMQSDGNLVMYAPGNRAVWATGTNRPGSYLGMQGDGNLVVYAPGPSPVWASGTSGTLHLELQTDANAVLYDANHTARWSTAAIGAGDHGNVSRVQYNAYVQMRDGGWGDSEWSCLNNVFTRESGWRWNATNGQAYGIPQANPGNKMGASGADWQTNTATQVNWGLSYIRGRYSSPCGAWSFWQSHNYY